MKRATLVESAAQSIREGTERFVERLVWRVSTEEFLILYAPSLKALRRKSVSKTFERSS